MPVLSKWKDLATNHFSIQKSQDRPIIASYITNSPTITRRTAHIGHRTVQLKPGDFIGFTPSSKETHFIKNDTMEEIRFLVICSNPEKDQTVYGVVF